MSIYDNGLLAGEEEEEAADEDPNEEADEDANEKVYDNVT